MVNPKKNKSEEPSKQHFVPKVYLKNFCNSAGKLQVYDTKTKRTLSNMSPAEVASQSHLYTIEVEKAKKDYRVEKYLGELESEYGAILTRLEATASTTLTVKDTPSVLRFISFLYARNPTQLSRYSKIASGVLSFMAESMIAHNLREQNESHLRTSFEVTVSPTYIQIATMKTMFAIADKIFTDMTNSGRWFFLRSRSDMEFITTDDPAANMVMVPLSKKLLLMRTTEDVEIIKKINTVIDVPPKDVVRLNGQIAVTAKRWVYASTCEMLTPAIGQIDSHLGSTPDLTRHP
jgi:hypothetical protein